MSEPGNSAPPNIEPALETLRNVLDELSWEPKRAEGVAGFEVDFGPPYLPVANALAAISVQEQFVFYLNFGFTAAPELRDTCAQFIARANWGLTIGNFEMDYEDGQLRFKSSVAFAGAELTETLIKNAIRAAMNAVDVYADPLAAIVMRGETAAAAWAQVDPAKA